ncbi:MAG: hypothetical protein ACE37F_15920 [Nannocystaceae bacterium]|nr:hypothetical protein [bacterium]
MTMPSRIGLAALLGASFVPCLTGSASAAPADAATDVAAPGPATPPETPSDASSDAPAPSEASPESAADPGAGPETPAPPTEEAGAVPEAPPAAQPQPATPAEDVAAREGTDTEAAAPTDEPATGPEKSGAIDPDLLSAEPSDPSSVPPPTTRRVVVDPGAYEAALLAAYDAQYRPADNPGRLHVGARVLFANAGGDNDVGGRMGGAQVDVGQAWNRIGYALTASAWGGRVLLGDRVAEMNGLFGLGPSLTYGRTALQQRGMIDFRVGYDFMYGVVNRRTDTGIVAPVGNDSPVVLEQADNLLPHGPRAMLQLGLLSPVKRNYNHGFGVVFGYQGLVGSLRGELPFTHMLVTGLQWWMG